MAGVKISALPAAGSALITDIIPVVQGGITKRETLQQIATLFNSGSVLTGFVPIAGGTMTGPLILSGDPTLPLGAVTKQYADAIAAGFTVILACNAATTANLNATQAGAGIGATLTNAGAMAALVIDGFATTIGDRILVKNQTLTQHNGVYSVTTVGSGAVNWVLTRATDYDTNIEIVPGTLIAINSGTVNATTSWLETATVVTVDTDPVLFSQFTFAPTAFLQKANNLSDLASVAAALVNLGLGVPTGTGNVVLQTSPTLITPTLGAATATTLAFNPTTGGIIGTNLANNTTAGNVGEFITSVVTDAARVAMASTTPTNITSIALSAGDWDVWGNVVFRFSVGGTGHLGWLNTVSATPVDLSLMSLLSFTAAQGNCGFCIPSRRFSFAGPTTVFLIGETVFASGTCGGFGGIYARRRR